MMTPEQQRVALAEWCGWKRCPIGVGMEEGGTVGPKYEWREYINGQETWRLHDRLPDFLHDLNAVAKAEEGVRYEECEQERYEEELLKVVIRQLGYQGANQLIHATAAQRCEALCRTLWPERWNERMTT